MCLYVHMWARKIKCIHEMRCSRSGPQSLWASRPPEACRNKPFVNYLWFSSCESVSGASASCLQLKAFSLGEKKNLTTLSPKTARRGCQKEKLEEKKTQQIGNSNPSPIYWHLTVPLHTWHLIWPQPRQMVEQEKKFLFCKWLDWVHPYGRWHHPYGRKRRRTKEPLNESERGEWKGWLKTQHSEN